MVLVKVCPDLTIIIKREEKKKRVIMSEKNKDLYKMRGIIISKQINKTRIR